MKKKLLISAILVFACTLLLCTSAFADDTVIDSGQCGDNLTYEITCDGKLTISGSGDMWNFMPQFQPYYEGIRYAPWQCCEVDITSLEIDDSVTRIGNWAFHAMETLADDIRFPAMLEEIGCSAFSGSSVSGNLVFPHSLRTIESNAFMDCEGLTGDLILSYNVESVGDAAFHHCTGLDGTLTVVPSVSVDQFSFYYAAFSTVYDGTCSIDTYESGVNYIYPTDYGTCGSKCCWTFWQDGLLGIYGSGEMSNIRSSSEQPWHNYVGSGPFYTEGGCVSELFIEPGITRIGDYAFKDFLSPVDGLVIPDSVTIIGRHAFDQSTGFTGTLTLSDNLVGISEFAFNHCSGLVGTLDIPSANIIGRYAFDFCTGFDGLVLPEGLTEIGQYAFADCWYIPTLEFPSTLLEIGDGAFFMGQGAIGNVGPVGNLVLPPNLRVLGARAFFHCCRITGILNIPDSLQSIGESCFSECRYLTGIQISCDSQLTSIGSFAFYSCYRLSGTLYIPASLNEMGRCNPFFRHSFSAICVDPQNTEFYLSNNCLIYRPTQRVVLCTTGYQIPSDGSIRQIGAYSCSEMNYSGDLILPYGITDIEECAFGWQGTDILRSNNINRLEIPVTVTEIGDSAFYGTDIDSISGFTDLEQGFVDPRNAQADYNGLTIGASAFCLNNTRINGHLGSDLSGKSLNIPYGVECIGKFAFADCGFTGTLVLPSSLSSIGSNAFGEFFPPCANSLVDYLANSLMNYFDVVYNFSSNVDFDPELHSYRIYQDYSFTPANSLVYNASVGTLHPIGGEPVYRIYSNYYGSYRVSRCGDMMEYALWTDGTLVFQGKGAMYNGQIFDFDESIGSCVLRIVLPEGITTIGDYAFDNLTQVTYSVTIPSTVNNIGKYAFYNVGSSLQPATLYSYNSPFGAALRRERNFHFSLPESLTKIGSYAFAGCSTWTGDLIIPNSVWMIGDHAFFGCSGLNGCLQLPSSLTRIENYAFANCSGLRGRLTIPSSTVYIGAYAFSNCRNLSGTIYVDDSRMTVHRYSFFNCPQITVIHQTGHIIPDTPFRA